MISIQFEVHEVDLLTIGTVGQSGIQGVFLGKIADRMAATCQCSVLTTKSDGFVPAIDPAL